MPARWKNVHDCERPSRWREQVRLLLGHVHFEVDTRRVTVCTAYGCILRYTWLQLDDEDCKIRLEQLKSGDAQASAAAAFSAGSPNPYPNQPQALNPHPDSNPNRDANPNQVVYDVGGSSSGADSGYSDLVPNLVSMEDFLSASRGAARQNKARPPPSASLRTLRLPLPSLLPPPPSLHTHHYHPHAHAHALTRCSWSSSIRCAAAPACASPQTTAASHASAPTMCTIYCTRCRARDSA